MIFILGILLVCYKLISPFEDRELGEYAESQAGTTADPAKYPDHVSFTDVTSGIRAGLDEDQPIDFESLRTYGKENKLDYSSYFQPPEGVLNTISSRLFPFWIKPGIRAGHVKDRDKRNDMVLRTLLSNSQASIKLGLDLRGGIAFTMEARDLNVTADGTDPSEATAMDKVVEIMNERLNAFGVAETVVQKKGDRAIEIKIPDRTTKQNP